MIEVTIPNVQDIPTQVVTAVNVDKYCEYIYDWLYITRVIDTEDKLLRAALYLSVELSMYLRTIELVVTGVRVEVDMDYYRRPTVLMYITFTPPGLNIMLSLLKYEDYAFGSTVSLPIYQVVPCNEEGITYSTTRSCMGADFLATSIVSIAGWYNCDTCYYSDIATEYCGLGMHMYTTSCSKQTAINAYMGKQVC